MPKRYFFTISFISWIVFVTFSSLYSFDNVDPPRFNIPHLDKLVHFTFYFVACFFGVLFLRERSKGKMSLKKALLIMVLVTISYGLLIEFLQYQMTTNRMGDLYDGLANTLGSICGALCMKFLFSAKRRLKWEY